MNIVDLIDFNTGPVAFKLGDLVRIKYPETNLDHRVGKITDIETVNFWSIDNWYTVVNLDGELPFKTVLISEQMVLLSSYICSCGSDKLGHPGHSYYCEKGKV